MNTMMKYAAYNEARRRDGRGRFTSEMENGMRSEGNDRMRAEAYGEMRMGGTRGESANRYEQRMEGRYEDEGRRMEGRYENRQQRVEPGRDDPMQGNGTFRMAYDGGEARRMIGFGGVEGRYESPLKGDEFRHRKGSKERGYSQSSVVVPLNEKMAEEWVYSMKNADGTTGPHWTIEQAEKLMKQKGIDCDPVMFWACLNAEYSDRCEVYKKYGIDSQNFYADCVKAFWLEDEDAVEDKAAVYYACIVKQ